MKVIIKWMMIFSVLAASALFILHSHVQQGGQPTVASIREPRGKAQQIGPSSSTTSEFSPILLSKSGNTPTPQLDKFQHDLVMKSFSDLQNTKLQTHSEIARASTLSHHVHNYNKNTPNDIHHQISAKHSNENSNSKLQYESITEDAVGNKVIVEAVKLPSVQKSGGQQGNADVSWCLNAKKKYNVNPGKSWGSLRGDPRAEWAKRGCDTVVATGRSFSCDDMWGNSNYFTSWKVNEVTKCDGESSIVCRTQKATSSVACKHTNVVIDFSKSIPSANNRDFGKYFLTAACGKKSDKSVPLPPGAVLTPDAALPACDYREEKPTIFMSHDLIFNLGHTISDFWIVWTTMRALELEFGDYQLVNMDAIRGNGPAGRGSKLTYAGHPDHISPFFAQYEQWFKHGVKKSIDYGKKKVCFKNAVFQAKPGPAHIWTALEYGKNSTTQTCSYRTGYRSSLLKEYNLFNRVKWGLIPHLSSSVIQSLASLQKADIHKQRGVSFAGQSLNSYAELKDYAPSITLVMRKGDNMRVFMNENEVVEALQDIPGAGVFKAVDFSVIPFREQIQLVHNTSLLIGMHGAALFHLLSMDVDSAVGCGVVELYHKRWSQSEAVPTVSNMARFLGVDYYVLRSKESETVKEIRTRGKGTLVDAPELRVIVTQAINTMNKRKSNLLSNS